MDKDILMIDALRKIILILNRFSAGPKIKPEIKRKLDPKRLELGDLFVQFTELLLEDTNLINEEELDFVGKIREVILYGIDAEQGLVLQATDRLITYIREKTALVRIAIGSDADEEDPDAG